MDAMDTIIRSDYGGCNPFTDAIIVLNARCMNTIVEVFVVGKWRPITRCRKTTTEIRDNKKLNEMRQSIKANAGWNTVDELKNKPINFNWGR